jgi:hypothetical protein
MKCNTRSGRIIREETRKERLTRPSNFAISTIRRPHTEVYRYTTTDRARLQARLFHAFSARNPSLFGEKTVAHATGFVLSDALIPNIKSKPRR